MRVIDRNSRNSLDHLNRSRTSSGKKSSKRGFFLVLFVVAAVGTYFFYGQNLAPANFNPTQINIVPTRVPTVETKELTLEPASKEVFETDPNFLFIETDIKEKGKYTFKENKLSFNFTKDDIGKKYQVTLTNSEQDKIIYNIGVTIEDLDFTLLETKIKTTLGPSSAKYGVYIKDLKRNKVASLNSQRIYAPASISKVPIALLVLKDIQAAKFKLDDTFPMRSNYKVYASDGMSGIPNGRQISLDTYITTMIKESDNTAMTALENILTNGNGIKGLKERYQTELGIDTFFRDPHESKADDIGKVFENIYLGKYLDKERNDYLLDKLFNTAERFQDRIQAGVKGKANTTVAHKIGQVVTENGYSYNDAGIVYGPKTDFVIVVINEAIGEADARANIVEITEVAFEFMND